MSLLTEVGKGLAGEWVKRALAPVSLFWLGGIVAWSARSGIGFEDLWPGDTGEQLAVAVIVLVIVGGSVALMEAFGPHWLRLAEGYWPGLLRPLRAWLVQRQVSQINEKRRRWQELIAKEEKQVLTSSELDERIRLDVERSRL